MNTNYSIQYEPNPTQDDIQILQDGIQAYASLKKNQPQMEFFAFFIRNEDNKILGGSNGAMYYGCLYIDNLWLDEKLRGKHLGTELMQAAEKLAKEKGCLFSTVNTMDWEALGFYKKLGYKVEFERTGYFNNSTLYFLRKDF